MLGPSLELDEHDIQVHATISDARQAMVLIGASVMGCDAR
jgi:hypothetical protein